MLYTKPITLFVVSYLFLSHIVSAASPVFVDANYTSTTDDTHTFGVDAFKTIGEAIQAVDVDGIIYIKKGIYNEALTIEKSLSLTGLAEQSVMGATTESPTIDGGNALGTIFIRGSSTPIKVSIYNLHINRGNHGVLVIQDAKVLITNNTIENYTKNGVTFGSKVIKGEGKISGTIRSNTIRGAGKTNILSQNGIQVADNNTAIITENTISDHIYTRPGTIWATGILLHNSSNVTASKNILINNQAGINILQANNITLEDNTIIGGTSTDAGIMVTTFDTKMRKATRNVIHRNIITGGYVGIWSSYAAGNRYTKNTISSTTQYGMYLWDTDSNTILDNTINSVHANGRSGYGIALNGGDTQSTTIGSDSNYISKNTVTDSDSSLYIANNSRKNVVVKNKF